MSFLLVDDGTDRSRWLNARRSGVSATDAARIMTGGAGTWASIRAEKTRGADWGGNEFTRHGREREQAIADWAAAEFGLRPSTALIAHADRPADLATPDALADPVLVGLDEPTGGRMEPGLIYDAEEFGEFKTTVHDWPTWDDVPARYHWQVAWQFHVTGAERCRFVFEPHRDFVPLYMEPRVFTIERADVEDAIAAAVERVEEWRAAGDLAAVPESLLPLDSLLSARQRAKEAAADSQALVDEYDARIRELLAEHGEAVEFEGTDATLSWSGKPRTSTRFDSAAFREQYPAAYRRFTRTVTEKHPRLNITARS